MTNMVSQTPSRVSRARLRSWLTAWIAPLAVAMALPPTAAGQVAVESATCPQGAAQVGDLGVDLECADCGLTYDGSSRTWRWRFRSEPTIEHVSRSGPSAGKLQNRDVLVSIEDVLITTRRGGVTLATLEPDELVAVQVRRNGREYTYSIRPAAACPTDVPPTRGSGGVAYVLPPVPPVRPDAPEPPQAPSARPAPAARPGLPPSSLLGGGTRAWFGFGLSCNQCSLSLVNQEEIATLEAELASNVRVGGLQADEVEGLVQRIEPLREAGYQWSFEEYPRIFSVDDGGPADQAGIRRGDLLTHIDGLSLLSEEGGKHLGQVQPGQRVEVVYQRGSTIGTAKLVVVTAPSPYGVAARSAYLRSLALMSSSLGRLERTQDPVVLAEVARLQAELQASETERQRAAVEAIRAERVRTYPVRYSGVIAKVNVTVRSRASVVVTRDEETGEVVITTSDATVRVKPEDR